MATTRSSQHGKTLDAKFFLSPEIYSLESERIFRRHWLCVGRAAEVPNAGDLICREVEGEDLLIVRGGDGRINAFHNVCRHRGTRLCSEPRLGSGTAIRCPYHGWSYATDGRLVFAPNMHDVPDFSTADFPLHAVAATEWQGFVLVQLQEPATADPPRESLGELINPWEFARLVSVKQLVYDVRANWKLIFQNYNECYHCPRVHPRLNALSSFQTATNFFDEGPVLGGPMRLADGVESMSLDGRACGRISPGLNAEQRRQVCYFSLFPTLLISPHPDFVLVHRIERLAVDATRVVCEFLFSPDSAADDGFDPTPAIEFWDQVNREDWRVCELSQQGIKSSAYQPGPFSNLESIVAAFDRHYRAVLETEPN